MDQIENNQAEQSVVEADTTQTSSPAVQKETTVPQTTEGEAVQQNVPDGPKFQSEEERKAFQDMRLENKRLKEEIAARRGNESAFAAFKPQAQVVNPQAYTDPYTGEVDQTRFNQVQLQAAKAEAAQAARDEIDEFQAKQKFPELFSDPETEELVANTWVASKLRGENVSITSVAERLSKRLGKVVSKAEKIGMEKAIAEVTPKEQAGLQASSQSASSARSQQNTVDRQDTVMATRLGNEDAIAARMRAVPWANK